MKSPARIADSILRLCFVILVATSTLYAAPIRVDCGKGGSVGGTLASLTAAGDTRGVTILVTGTCKENIVITAFDHLKLQALPVATLQDASNGSLPVVTVGSSYDVTVQGFTITGGADGVVCFENSVCSLTLNVVQGSTVGVSVVRADATLTTNQIQDTGTALDVRAGARVLVQGGSIQGNHGYGALARYGGNLTIVQTSIVNNGRDGVRASMMGTMRLYDSTISGNAGNGVTLQQASSASFEQSDTGNTITGNGGNGVSVHDLSFAAFVGANNVSGNLTPPDVACFPQYSATRGAGTVMGTTNCVEP